MKSRRSAKYRGKAFLHFRIRMLFPFPFRRECLGVEEDTQRLVRTRLYLQRALVLLNIPGHGTGLGPVIAPTVSAPTVNRCPRAYSL